MDILIRNMIKEDISYFPEEFLKQGWHKEEAQYQLYFDEQERGIRQVFVATVDGNPAGYATLLPQDTTGPFKDRHIPVIIDFNVLIKYQKMGVGTAIMDCIEASVKEFSSDVCLGVGLHYGYGSAQRMYVKRGYIPDGSGVWFNGERLEQYSPCCNDDELVLYLSKRLSEKPDKVVWRKSTKIGCFLKELRKEKRDYEGTSRRKVWCVRKEISPAPLASVLF